MARRPAERGPTLHAHKLTTTIPKSRRVEIDLPSDVPDGEAEVIVLFREGSSAGARPGSREAVVAEEPVTEAWRAANPDRMRTADEIDAHLRDERGSWGDDG